MNLLLMKYLLSFDDEIKFIIENINEYGFVDFSINT